jgi:hypothetical protein
MDRDARRRLKALGAADFPHVNGPLLPHLEGTYELLKKWNARQALCDAGLFHSVYGTAGYDQRLVSLGDRDRIVAIIGAEAERIVYLFSACDRDFLYDQILQHEAPQYRDRIDGTVVSLDPRSCSDLCELTMANECQIMLASRRAAGAQRERFRPLFDRMQRHVGGGAWEEWSRISRLSPRRSWF